MSSYILKPLGGEIELPTTTGAATSLSQAKRVRILNCAVPNRVVTIVESQGGGVIGSFTIGSRGTIPGGGDGDVIIEKEYTQCVFADAAQVKAVSVGIVGY